MVAPRKYPDELRERAVRLYQESDPKPVIRRLAEQLNVHPEALRNWIRQNEADCGQRHDRPSIDMIEENRRLRREVAEPGRHARPCAGGAGRSRSTQEVDGLSFVEVCGSPAS